MSVLRRFVCGTIQPFIKDFTTDALLLPRRSLRYLLYAVVAIALVLMPVAVIQHEYRVAWFSSILVNLVLCKYIMLAYRYIQNKDGERR